MRPLLPAQPPVDTGYYFTGLKRLMREVDHSPFVSEVQKFGTVFPFPHTPSRLLQGINLDLHLYLPPYHFTLMGNTDLPPPRPNLTDPCAVLDRAKGDDLGTDHSHREHYE
jgi:hypothetical protein